MALFRLFSLFGASRFPQVSAGALPPYFASVQGRTLVDNISGGGTAAAGASAQALATGDAGQASGGQSLSGAGQTSVGQTSQLGAGGTEQASGVESSAQEHSADGTTAAEKSRHAVVIGGGIAGLSAAWELQRKGWSVTVLEQGAQVGGAVQTVQRDGWQVECGPNTMMVTSHAFEEMINGVGLIGRIVKPSTSFKKRFLVRGGQLHAGPASFGEFAKTPLFSTGAKLRLFWNLVWGGGLRKDLEDESLGSYFRRQFGQEVVDVAIRPVITGVYAGDADRLSLRHGFPFVWEAAKRSRSVLRGVVLNLLDKRKQGTGFKNYMISFEGGLHTLPSALALALETAPVTSARVTSIRREQAGGKWDITYSAGEAAAPVELVADALVLAAPSFAVSGLPLPQDIAQHLAALNDIEYPPLANVALGYRREQVGHALDGFGAVVGDKEKAQILGVLFSSSVYPQVAPDGHVLLTSFIGGTRAPALASLPEQELVRHTHEQLRHLLNITGEPVFANTVYWPRAIPQVTVGYGRFLSELDAVEAANPSLAIVGNYRGEIALGKCAADSLLRARALSERMQG